MIGVPFHLAGLTGNDSVTPFLHLAHLPLSWARGQGGERRGAEVGKANTFFLGPGSLRSDKYLPSLKVPGTGPRRKPAGMQQSALTLVAEARAAACIAAAAARQMLGRAGSLAGREGQSPASREPGSCTPTCVLRPRSDAAGPALRLFNRGGRLLAPRAQGRGVW